MVRRRLLALGEGHGVRISITPQVPPGLLDGIDPARAGRDVLPATKENFEVINARTTNWTVVPWAVPEWARLVHPGLDDEAAMAKLWEQLIYTLRLDEPDAAEAWRVRLGELHDAGTRLNDRQFDALRFQGPGTDLTVGAPPPPASARRPGHPDHRRGHPCTPNIPTEEVTTRRTRAGGRGRDGDEAARRLSGTVLRNLEIRFEGGRAVAIDGQNAKRCCAAWPWTRVVRASARSRSSTARGASARPARVFFNTLLDENAASHLALGDAYATHRRRRRTATASMRARCTSTS